MRKTFALGIPASLAASSAVWSFDGHVKMALDPESLSWKANSDGTKAALAGATTPSRRRTDHAMVGVWI